MEEENKFDDYQNMIVSSDLADIVLMKKHEMEEWQHRQEVLR